MVGWIVVAAIVLATLAGVIVLFRSLRRWQQPPTRTADQIQAEMQLYAESRQTDRW